MVLRVDAASRTFIIWHEPIEGLMSAMVMPFEVRDALKLTPIAPGALVEFTLVVGPQAGVATGLRVLKYQTAEQDPLTARRLRAARRRPRAAPSRRSHQGRPSRISR